MLGLFLLRRRSMNNKYQPDVCTTFAFQINEDVGHLVSVRESSKLAIIFVGFENLVSQRRFNNLENVTSLCCKCV